MVRASIIGSMQWNTYVHIASYVKIWSDHPETCKSPRYDLGASYYYINNFIISLKKETGTQNSLRTP